MYKDEGRGGGGERRLSDVLIGNNVIAGYSHHSAGAGSPALIGRFAPIPGPSPPGRV